VSYDAKHNDANGEDNRDGVEDNLSWNCGVEGSTDDPAVRALRARQTRNFLATLFLSQGIPMLCGGDEIGRTQGGNNNAYCQDNETSWHDWGLDDARRALLDFTGRLVRLRRDHPELRRRKFFQGRPLCAAGMKDLAWLAPDGTELSALEWRAATLRAFGLRLCGDAMDDVDERGQPVAADTLLVLFNARAERVNFVLPDGHAGAVWETLLDTAVPEAPPARHACGSAVVLPDRSLRLFRAAAPAP
jgi:glycogen operon protein